MRVLPSAPATTCLSLAFALTLSLHAQIAPPPSVPDRVSTAVDDARTVRLRGDRHPLATPEFDAGAVAPDVPFTRLILSLKPSPAQQAALDALVAAQHDPSSPEFHQWLTPQQFGARFGVSPADATKVARWLTAHGFSVEEVSPSRQSILFSGTATAIQATFRTEMRHFSVGGRLHVANAEDPEIPQALAPVVGGIVSLHDFHRKPMHTPRHASAPPAPKLSPLYTGGQNHNIAPADFATIYNLAPLYSANIDGTGQTIAIVGRTNIALSDIRSFRSMMGLPANDPTVVLNGADPGVVNDDEETEADLDVEWSGAVAPKAAVKFVVSASTYTTDGVDLSASYIVNHNLAPVLSVSFGECEAYMGSSELSFYNSLWQQAAAQGITAFVSSGDSGAAGCDSSGANTAHAGAAVNGLCSSPYSVCVGGTEFNEGSASGLYWSNTNSPTTFGSALAYIPEVAWNESRANGGSGLAATGGGASTVYPKPAWQTGLGVPADAKRDVPDVALTAAGHDGYLLFQNGNLYAVGGTSASSPSFAGIMALVIQKTAARQGNANSTFYPLFALQNNGGAALFHSVTGGNNSVPGAVGFTASANYNQATGLGSVDANLLVNHWTDAASASTPPPTFTVTPSASTLSLSRNSSGTLTVSTAGSNGFNSAVALSVTGVPSGATARFTPASVAAPGSGSSTFSVSTGTAAPGSYPLTITATGGGVTRTASVSLTIASGPACTLHSSASSVSLVAGSSASVQLTCDSVQGGLSSALSLSASGKPAGSTVTFAPTTLTPGAGNSVLTISASTGAATGASTLTVNAAGGGFATSLPLSVTVRPAPDFTFAASGVLVNLVRGASASLNLKTTGNASLNAAVALAVKNLPGGVTSSLTPASIAAPGSGTGVLTLTANSTSSVPGRYLVSVSATAPGLAAKTLSLTVILTAATKH